MCNNRNTNSKGTSVGALRCDACTPMPFTAKCIQLNTRANCSQRVLSLQRYPVFKGSAQCIAASCNTAVTSAYHTPECGIPLHEACIWAQVC